MRNIIRVAKEQFDHLDWRNHVAKGGDHPLKLETENYRKILIHTVYMDEDAVSSHNPHHNSADMEFIKMTLRDPKMQWALDNSFDGFYISKEHDVSTFNTIYKIFVYLKEEHVTFWKLKF